MLMRYFTAYNEIQKKKKRLELTTTYFRQQTKLPSMITFKILKNNH